MRRSPARKRWLESPSFMMVDAVPERASGEVERVWAMKIKNI